MSRLSVPPCVVTIAGSDSSGGAGIQADLKTFSALGCYGASVVTALTAQNTQGVQRIDMTDVAMVRAQFDAVYEDLDIRATKIGMIGTGAVAQEIADGLRRHSCGYTILDPVMVAESGDVLMEDTLLACLKSELIPLADLMTPNLYEAAVLLNCDVADALSEMRAQAEQLLGIGARAILLKGGHFAGDMAPDLYVDCSGVILELSAPRVMTRHTHGTGCTLSSAIAAHVARGFPIEEALRLSKAYITDAIRFADQLNVGAGAGPVHHFYDLWTS